jgi:hypothetical protein
MTSTYRAACMKCRIVWNEKFLMDNFTKSWVTTKYRKHRKRVALEMEKLRIPDSMEKAKLLRRYHEEEKIFDNIYHTVRSFRLGLGRFWRARNEENENILRRKYQDLINLEPNYFPRMEMFEEVILHLRQHTHDVPKCKCTMFHCHKPEKKIFSEFVGIQREICADARNAVYHNRNLKAEFVCKCPYEDCRGMIYHETWLCSLCEKEVCAKCQEKKENEHKCDRNIVESVKMLKKDTKACPKCAVPIHRLYGCDQMWCTQCHLTFNWETLQEEKGIIHNPHAIEWARIHGNNRNLLNGLPCGGWIEYEDLVITISRNVESDNAPPRTWSTEYIETIMALVNQPIEGQRAKYFRSILDAYDIFQIWNCVNEFRYRNPFNLQNKLEELRLDYLLGKIDEKKWEHEIFRMERKAEKRDIQRDIYDTLIHLFIERFRHLCESIKEGRYDEEKLITHLEKFREEMEEIRVFVNNAFVTETSVLGKPYSIPDTWFFDATKFKRYNN